MKKVLALVLAVVLAFGMTTVAFAAAADRVKEVLSVGTSTITMHENGIKDTLVTSTGSIDSIIAVHNTTYRIWLQESDFAWSKRANEDKGEPITLSNLTSVTVKASWKKGGEYFNSPELKYNGTAKQCFIELKTKKGITVTSDKDIDGKIILTYKSTKVELPISGLAQNQEELVVEDDESVWINEYNYIKADDFIKNLEVNFSDNDDVLAYMNVFGGKKYYIWIEEDVQSVDEEVIATYDSIEAVYHAYYSSNASTPSTYVVFDVDETYYVYDKDGKYIGLTTDKQLPLSTVYYLSSKKIDEFGGAVDEEPGDAPAAEDPSETPENPDMGGDNGAPNANDNPGTGANGLVSVAVAAGLVALAAAGISKK